MNKKEQYMHYYKILMYGMILASGSHYLRSNALNILTSCLNSARHAVAQHKVAATAFSVGSVILATRAMIPRVRREILARQEYNYSKYRNLVYDTLVIKNKRKFPQRGWFPILEQGLYAPHVRHQIFQDLHATRIIAPHNIHILIDSFLTMKRSCGTSAEREIYKNMTIQEFIERLWGIRPWACYDAYDSENLLCNDVNKRGEKNPFENVQNASLTDEVSLKNCFSSAERMVGAFFGISSPTYFINSGERHNKGKIGPENSYEEHGNIAGMIGPCFEKRWLMDWKYMVVDKVQNTKENGYGKDRQDSKENSADLALWAQWYGVSHFPSFEEVEKEEKYNQESYIKIKYINEHIFLNKEIYKKRLTMLLQPFFTAAAQRGQQTGKKIVAQVPGFGLGAWCIDGAKEVQSRIFIEVCQDIFKGDQFLRSHISDVCFNYFDAIDGLGKNAQPDPFIQALVPNQINNQKDNNTPICFKSFNESYGINMYFSRDPHAKKLKDKQEGKEVFSGYAYDMTQPGNEYYLHKLDDSGDPAAACCSGIVFLQNINLNPNIRRFISHTWGRPQGVMQWAQWTTQAICMLPALQKIRAFMLPY
jgi:hypothetical protein